MDPITTQQQLKKHLRIDSIDQLTEPDVLKRFGGLAKYVTPELFTELLRAAPKTAKAFTDYLASLNDYGAAIEASKQQRWQFLTEAAKTGQMTGEQIFEGMRFLGEMDTRDASDFDRHRTETKRIADQALKLVKLAFGLAAAAIIAAGALAVSVVTKSRGSRDA